MEDILKTLGYSPSEIDKRILLLSAQKPERQFKTIPNNLAQVIADMQYTPKSEKRAKGIFQDPVTVKIGYVVEY